MPKSEEKRKPRPGKGKKNESLQLLRAITKSLAGAIPGVSEETRDTIDDSLARPISGFTSQIMAEDPENPGQLVFPPWDNMKKQWRSDERRKKGLPREPTAMPGMIQETMAIPAMFGGGPQWAQDASASADRIHGAVDEGMGLEAPRGFRQNALNSLGMMGAQIPVAGKAKELPEIGKGALHLAKKYGAKALKSPVEFFSPTIEPKMSNYLFGAGAGGALGTLADETGEVAEEVPPPRAISRAEGGKVGALKQILKMISINPDSTVKQKGHMMGDPVEEVLYATNEGQRKGVLSSDEAKRIKMLLAEGEEEELSNALLDLHSRLFPTPKMPEPKISTEGLVDPHRPGQFREPLHGTGSLTQEEWEQQVMKTRRARGGSIRRR
jgi:hypothetical protein